VQKVEFFDGDVTGTAIIAHGMITGWSGAKEGPRAGGCREPVWRIQRSGESVFTGPWGDEVWQLRSPGPHIADVFLDDDDVTGHDIVALGAGGVARSFCSTDGTDLLSPVFSQGIVWGIEVWAPTVTLPDGSHGKLLRLRLLPWSEESVCGRECSAVAWVPASGGPASISAASVPARSHDLTPRSMREYTDGAGYTLMRGMRTPLLVVVSTGPVFTKPGLRPLWKQNGIEIFPAPRTPTAVVTTDQHMRPEHAFITGDTPLS
jgi:hypothetical protein